MLRRPWHWIAVVAFALLLGWWFGPCANSDGDGDSAPPIEPGLDEPPAVPNTDSAGNPSDLTSTEVVAQEGGAPEQAPSIQRLTDGFLLLEDPQGNQVQGRSILVAEDETMLGWMAIPGRVGSAIYHESILQEGESIPGTEGLPISEVGNHADLHFVIAEGYEPIVEAWEPIAAGETHRTTLTPVEPIRVRVQNPDGDPIPGAEVWVRWIGELTLNEGGTTLERLHGRHYQEAVITDEKGETTVDVCFPGKANSLFVRPGDAFASQQVVCSSGEEVVITCETAFAIKGKVTIDGQLPDREVRLMAMLPIGESFSFLESARAKEEGRYSIGGVLTGYPTVLVQAMGEDLAMQMRHIPGGEPGEVIEIDFDMKPGLGGELLVNDAWGSPLPGATVQLVGEGDQRHVYLYEANEGGKVTLPVAFPLESQYWMELGFSGMTMRLPEDFQAGDELVLQARNQARITSVQLTPDLLGEASLSNLIWRSREPMAGGEASWESSTETSPVLVAGRGSLTATLSDGRQFTMGTYLEPGSQDPLVFDVQPAILRFQVPDGIVVSVYLFDQLGNYLFGGEGLEGPVEVPCWEGEFSLGIYWEDGSFIRPGIHVPSEGRDLGMLGLGNAGAVYGTVRDEAGSPIGWCDVVISSHDGYYYFDGVSDLDGSYFMGGLPLGEYYLYASSHTYHGGEGESRIQQFAITAAEPEVHLEVVMGAAEGHLSVRHETGPVGGMEILLVTPSGVQFREASPTGTSQLPAQPMPGWVGAVHAQGTNVRVSSAPVQAGPGAVVLPEFSSQFREVKVVDEHGAPRLDMILRIELAGNPPTGRLAPDGDGALHFSVTGDGPLALYARDGLGMSHTIPLDEAMAVGRFVVPRELPSRLIHVVDTTGKAIPRARAMDDGLQDVFRADHEGQILVPVKYDWMIVDARGFLPVWVGPDHQGVVDLPPARAGVKLVLPEGGASLTLDYLHAERSAVATEIRLSSAQREVILPPIPLGEIRVTLLNEGQEGIYAKTFLVDDEIMVLTMGPQ